MDLLSTTQLFQQFLAERRYLRNVTPSTIEWYETAFRALQRAQNIESPLITKTTLQQFVIDLRRRNVKPFVSTLSLTQRRHTKRLEEGDCSHVAVVCGILQSPSVSRFAGQRPSGFS
jgi:hypothetical protein